MVDNSLISFIISDTIYVLILGFNKYLIKICVVR
jgi:hypothetical protein